MGHDFVEPFLDRRSFAEDEMILALITDEGEEVALDLIHAGAKKEE